MANDAEQTARNAEQSTTCKAGYCLQWSRERAAIPSLYNDAADAWRATNDRHPGDRNPPRGSMVYWTGGSNGYGHIAVSRGDGTVRSTDAGGAGKVATVSLGWVENNWGLPYAGWAWDVNEVTIPHAAGAGGPDEMGNWDTDEELSAAVLRGESWKYKGEGAEPQTLQEHVTDLRRQMANVLEIVKRLDAGES